jgi:hypothetical protein
MSNIAAAALLCVFEIAALCILFKIDPMTIGLFAYFFLTHFFLTGAVLYLITTTLTKNDLDFFEIITVGVVADCAILLLAWRFDFMGAYVFYPSVSLVVFLVVSKWAPGHNRIFTRQESISTQFLLLVQVIPPLLWLFSSDIDRHVIDQLFGVRSVWRWPPPNLVVADVPYSNNYMLHLLLVGVHTVTHIDVELLVTRISPLFLSWLFSRSLFHFCFRLLHMSQASAALPGLCFFVVFGFSPVMAHIFGASTVTPAIFVQSPLFSFSIGLLIITMQSLLPKHFSQKVLIALAILVAAFIGTGARAQLGPVLICAQLLLLIHAIATAKREAIFWRAFVLVVLVAAVLAALIFFLTATSGFTGMSFLRFEVNPAHFIVQRLSWYYVAAWLSSLGLGALWSATVAFIVIIIMQATFLVPGLVRYISSCWSRGVVGFSSVEVLLLGTIIAGVAAVILTEAPGGSHYVFLHYSKIAAIILGAAGLAGLLRWRVNRVSGWAVCVLGGTAFLALAQLIDTAIAIYRQGPAKLAHAMRSHVLPDAMHAAALRTILANYDDRERSVFLYYDGLSHLGPYLLPVRLGLQVIGEESILKEYVTWESNTKGALRRRLCLLAAFNKAVKSHMVDDNLIYALGKTILGNYKSLYVIVPAATKMELSSTFAVGKGIDFRIYRIPMAVVAEHEQSRASASERCSAQNL